MSTSWPFLNPSLSCPFMSLRRFTNNAFCLVAASANEILVLSCISYCEPRSWSTESNLLASNTTFAMPSVPTLLLRNCTSALPKKSEEELNKNTPWQEWRNVRVRFSRERTGSFTPGVSTMRKPLRRSSLSFTRMLFTTEVNSPAAPTYFSSPFCSSR